MNYVDLERALRRRARELNAGLALLAIGMLLVMLAAAGGGYLYGRGMAWWAFGWFIAFYAAAAVCLASGTEIRKRAVARFHREVRA